MSVSARVYLDRSLCGHFELPYGFESMSPQKRFARETLCVLSTTETFQDLLAERFPNSISPLVFVLDESHFGILNANYAKLGASEKRLVYRYFEQDGVKHDVALTCDKRNEYTATFVGKKDAITPQKQVRESVEHCPPSAPERPDRGIKPNEGVPPQVHMTLTIKVDHARRIAITRDTKTRKALNEVCLKSEEKGLDTIGVVVLPLGHFQMYVLEVTQKIIVDQTDSTTFIFFKEIRGMAPGIGDNQHSTYGMDADIAQQYIDGINNPGGMEFDWTSLACDIKNIGLCVKTLHSIANDRKRRASDDSGCSSPRRLRFSDNGPEDNTSIDDAIVPLSQVAYECQP